MEVPAIADRIRGEIGRVIAGQEDVVDQLLVATFAQGHVLLEGVPGVAKTLLVRTLAYVIGLEFGRIQFTPDLMPTDVMGTTIFIPQTGAFEVRQGPIFVNIVLADEINRTPPKTQAALLEAMEERQVTIDGTSHQLPKPFLVFATQNPIEYEGTYPLPEAQQDRFLLKVLVNYPTPGAEIEVLRRHHAGFSPQSLEEVGIQRVVTAEELMKLAKEIDGVTVEDKIFDYIYGIVVATRKNEDLALGASPRAGIALLRTSKAMAAIRGRNFVIPDDVKALAVPVLRHRVLIRPEAELEGYTVERVVSSIVEAQAVPR